MSAHTDEGLEDRQGRIVTFYSYKGGTGRSMAVANVAWILASQGQRVLVIDWDLEAPGLHRYFHPYVADPELVSSCGIIDFLTAFVEGAHQAHPDQGEQWFKPYTDLEPYTFSLDWEFPDGGTLDVVPAGQQGPSYAARVTGFNWQGFYERLGGGVFLEAVKLELRREYDWVLVDSRTGISDTSGICTVQMPDDLVVCFTLNDQSMTGASAVTRSVMAQRTRPDGTPGVRVFPVRTRVERAETARLNAAKDMAVRTFSPFLAHLPEEAQGAYWGSAEVLYHPFYAYEEVLAPFGDPPQESGSMLSAMETIAGFLTDGAITRLAAMDESLRLKEKDRFLRQASSVPTPSAAEESVPAQVVVVPEPLSADADADAVLELTDSPGGSAFWAYLSYARVDADTYFQRFVNDLQSGLRAYTAAELEEVLFVDQRLALGDVWSTELARAVAASRTCVPLYSPAYFRSEHCGREFAYFLARSRLRGRMSPARRGAESEIIPVLWGPLPAQLPGAAAEIQFLHERFPEEYALTGLRSIMRRGGRRGPYMQVLEEIVRVIAETASRDPLPVARLPRLDRLRSAFGDAPAPSGREASVQVVYVVADRNTMRQVRRDVEVYGEDPLEWHPFGGAPLHALAARTAGAEKLFLDVMPFDDTIVERVQGAERAGVPVAVIVDPWTLELQTHAGLLRRLDVQLPGNVAVFLLWDSTDETRDERERLQSLVQLELPMLDASRARRYHAKIESEAAFTRNFASTVVSMTTELQAARQALASSASPTLSPAG